MGEQYILSHHHFHRIIRGIAPISMLHDKARAWFYLDELHKVFKQHARPIVIEAAPAGNAMEIGMKGCLRKGHEFVPRPDEFLLDFPPHTKAPILSFDLRCAAVSEDRKLYRCNLIRRSFCFAERIYSGDETFLGVEEGHRPIVRVAKRSDLFSCFRNKSNTSTPHRDKFQTPRANGEPIKSQNTNTRIIQDQRGKTTIEILLEFGAWFLEFGV